MVRDLLPLDEADFRKQYSRFLERHPDFPTLEYLRARDYPQLDGQSDSEDEEASLSAANGKEGADGVISDPFHPQSRTTSPSVPSEGALLVGRGDDLFSRDSPSSTTTRTPAVQTAQCALRTGGVLDVFPPQSIPRPSSRRPRETYLDYTGAMVPARSHVHAAAALLLTHVLGNPHSCSASSQRSSLLIEKTEAAVLEHLFNLKTPQERAEYTVLFTPNASGALRIVGEHYDWERGGVFALSVDNHNSVHGIREEAARHGAEVVYVPVDRKTLRMRRADVEAVLTAAAQDATAGGPPENVIAHARETAASASSRANYGRETGTRHSNRLFAYPLQSNVSGIRHSAELIAVAQALNYDVLVDTAAFLPTQQLDLTRFKPDFITMSFYKVFGYPTGIGCLVVKTSKLGKLKRERFISGERPAGTDDRGSSCSSNGSWFAGGSVLWNSVGGFRNPILVGASSYQFVSGKERFYDGTVDFSSGMVGVLTGLEFLRRVNGGWEDMRWVRRRVWCLTDWLWRELRALEYEDQGTVDEDRTSPTRIRPPFGGRTVPFLSDASEPKEVSVGAPQRRERPRTSQHLPEVSSSRKRKRVSFPLAGRTRPRKMLVLYGDHDSDCSDGVLASEGCEDDRGGTISFNVLDRRGKLVPFAEIEEAAKQAGISIRAGVHCNPGIHEVVFGLTPEKLGRLIVERSSPSASSGERQEVGKRSKSETTDVEADPVVPMLSSQHGGMVRSDTSCASTSCRIAELGCVRVSVGFPTNFRDVYLFVHFLRGLREGL